MPNSELVEHLIVKSSIRQATSGRLQTSTHRLPQKSGDLGYTVRVHVSPLMPRDIITSMIEIRRRNFVTITITIFVALVAFGLGQTLHDEHD
jgi:hypothetical protein